MSDVLISRRELLKAGVLAGTSLMFPLKLFGQTTKKTAKLSCDIIKANVPTVNNRLYTIEALQNLVTKINEKAADGRLFGEYGRRTTYDGRTRLSNVAVRALPGFKLENGMIVGEFEFLNTELGRQAAEFMASKDQVDAHTIFPVICADITECESVGKRFDVVDANTIDIVTLDIMPKEQL